MDAAILKSDSVFDRIEVIPNGLIFWPKTSHFQEIRTQLFESQDCFENLVAGKDSIGIYDPEKSVADIQAMVSEILQESVSKDTEKLQTAHHFIPMKYDRDSDDVRVLCEDLGMDAMNLFERHTCCLFTLEFYGFLPGFPYLSGLEKSLHHLRKTSASTRINAGSVAIANDMCGIYPVDSPGGWYVLGRVNPTFRKEKMQIPSAIKPGDTIQFVEE